MDANEQVYSVLSQDAALDALVNGRIWNINRSEAEGTPALVFRRVSTEYVGDAQSEDNLAGIRYQLDGYAQELSDAALITRTAINALRAAYQATKLSRRDLYNDRTQLYRVVEDCSVWLIDD